MTEELLHYVWKHKILPLRELMTTDGQKVEVVDPGLHNLGAGPDFFNSKVKIDGQLWVGNVEIHVRASDWYRHKHDADKAYANVILHVVADSDSRVTYPGETERKIPQMVLAVPDYVIQNYDHLSRSESFPPCFNEVGTFSALTIHSWMSALQVERLEQKSQAVVRRWEMLDRNWEETLFVTVARNFGFGKNGDTFERWARSFNRSIIGKHRDSLLQIEAVFFGQAGLLKDANDKVGDYYLRLRNEYKFLSHKFGLSHIEPSLWKRKVRPENFPEVRLAQLAMLYYRGCISLSKLLEAESVDSMYGLFRQEKGLPGVSEYWHTHYSFSDEPSPESEKRMSDSSLDLIIMNSVVPFIFAYGRYKGDDSLCDKAFEIMEGIRPENNSYIRKWEEAGVVCSTAADSQALMQLSKKYCEEHNCLRCRFGYEYIRRNPNFLSEEGDLAKNVNS